MSDNNNNNIHICIAPYGRNFRGTDVGDLPVLTSGNCVMHINDWGDQVVFETTHVRFFNFLKTF